MAYPNLPPAPPPPRPEAISSTNVMFNTSWDLSYLTTRMAILRILIVVLNAIGAICIACSPFSANGRGVFFTVVALSGLACSLALTCAHTCRAEERRRGWRWREAELGAALALMFLNMLTSTVVVAFGSPAYSAAGLFGYLCMVAYGAEAFLRSTALIEGQSAQGAPRKPAPPLPPPPPVPLSRPCLAHAP